EDDFQASLISAFRLLVDPVAAAGESGRGLTAVLLDNIGWNFYRLSDAEQARILSQVNEAGTAIGAVTRLLQTRLDSLSDVSEALSVLSGVSNSIRMLSCAT